MEVPGSEKEEECMGKKGGKSLVLLYRFSPNRQYLGYLAYMSWKLVHEIS